MADKSPFPDDFLDVDLYYDGDWQPLGTDLDQSGIAVAHGARSEGGSADVSSLSFTVTNSDGKYSPRNPTSPLYGLVGRNTPARARVALGAPWLDLEAPGARATTPDTAANSITGDIDIRWWGERDSWSVKADLMSKWNTTGNQRSWILRAEADGTLSLFWSADGTDVSPAYNKVTSLASIPSWAGRIALHVTLDVNNGAGGHTVRFEYADTLDGTWIQLGDDVINTGTTSIYNSTAALTLGKEPTSTAGTPPQRVYGWELRSGTVVSSGTTADLTVGATSFADDQGATWTVTDGSISNTHTLAVCEVAEWPMEWNRKGSPSVLTEVQAAGVTRRLGQGAEALESVLYRAISSVADSSVVAYWPLEDGSDSTSFGAAIGSQAAARGTNVSPAAYDFPGSAALPTITTSRIRGEVDPHTGTGEVQVRWVQHTPAAGVAAEVTLLQVEFTGGTISAVALKMNTSGDIGVFGYDQDGTQLAGSTYVSASIEDTSMWISLELNQDGSKVFWRRSTLEAGESTGGTFGQDFTLDQTLGRAARVIFNAGYNDMADIAVGHLTVGTEITSLFDGVSGDILTGHAGEDAGIRMSRLAVENGTSVTIHGRESADLGEQQEETLLDLLAESADADGGLLHDDSRSLGLRYRTLDSFGSQPPVTIPYTDNLVVPFEPTDDDGLTRNRVTVQRPNGTRVTEEVTEGPMSTQAPPAGVGVYDESLTLNLFSDDLVSRTAAWLVHVGTWDEGRYPTLGVDLAHPTFLADPIMTRDLLSITPGDRIVITDPPPWLPPRDVDVLVMGVEVEVTPLHLRLRWTCVPARPYRIAYWNAGHRWSGEGTVTSGSLTTTATSMPLTLPSGVAWTHADGDYDITVGGEVMTVTNVVGSTMTVTRSVNGVVKAHSAGAAVALADPSFYAR